MPARTWFPVLVAAVLVSVVATGVGASSPAWAAPTGASPVAAEPVPLAAVATCPRASGPTRAGGSWSVDVRVDDEGTLRGWILDGGTDDGSLPRIALPPESSMSRASGGRAVITADDGKRSVVAIASAHQRCVSILRDDLAFVARSAVLRPRDGTVWVHAVDRATRADLGVFRIVPGSRTVERFLAALPEDDPAVRSVGRVFATRLMLDSAHTRLAVQSCGERTCRTRIVDLADGRQLRLDGPNQGVLEAFDHRRAVFRTACGTAPCPVHAVVIAPPAAVFDR